MIIWWNLVYYSKLNDNNNHWQNETGKNTYEKDESERFNAMVDEDNIGGHTTQQQEQNTTTDATADDNADSMGAAQSFNIDVRFTSCFVYQFIKSVFSKC